MWPKWKQNKETFCDVMCTQLDFDFSTWKSNHLPWLHINESFTSLWSMGCWIKIVLNSTKKQKNKQQTFAKKIFCVIAGRALSFSFKQKRTFRIMVHRMPSLPVFYNPMSLSCKSCKLLYMSRSVGRLVNLLL